MAAHNRLTADQIAALEPGDTVTSSRTRTTVDPGTLSALSSALRECASSFPARAPAASATCTSSPAAMASESGAATVPSS